MAEELHKSLIRNFKKITVYSGFKDNIWGADLDDVQLMSNFKKGFKFLLWVIDIFSKFACVFPLKDRKGISIVSALQKILDKLDVNQTKYGWIKVVNFTIVLIKNG